MKYLFSTTAVLAAACAAFAQPSALHRPAIFHRDRPALVNEILAAQADRFAGEDAAAKPTAMVQRMVSEVTFDSTAGSHDSFRYFYFSPARGAAHNPKNPASFYPFDFSPFDSYDSTSAYGGYRTQYVQFDSARRYDFSPTGTSLGSEMLVRNQYNTANRITQMEHYENNAPTATRRYVLAYNAAGDAVSKTFYDEYPASTLALFSTQTSMYNAQHHPVVDSTFNHAIVNAPESRFSYSYNAGGQLAQCLIQNWMAGVWQPAQRTTYSYNTAGLLRSFLDEDYVGGVWKPDYKDSFVYSGTNPAFIAEHGSQWEPTTNTWDPYFRTFLHLNTVGNWDTVTTQYYDVQTATWGYLSRTTITYNSYNNWETLTAAYDDDDNGVINTGEVYGTNRYYYELWNNATRVEALPAATSFTVYPNPASARLSVRWSKTQVPVSYTVADIHGHTLSNGSVMTGASRLELDLSGYTPGYYFLSLTGADGSILHREKVVRQ